MSKCRRVSPAARIALAVTVAGGTLLCAAFGLAMNAVMATLR